MPHADSSNFSASTTKAYTSILTSLHALITEEPPNRSWISAAANTSSLLWHMFHSLDDSEPASAVNWVGFYYLDSTGRRLLLGPFMGKVACQTIKLGQGVCGSVAHKGQTEIVPDVQARPGHIACDGETKSEIVVPVLVGERVVGVLDIDCMRTDGFDEVDRAELERIVEVIGDECDW